jgi:hypothetical protein
MQKKWIIAEPYPAEFGRKFSEYPPIVVQLLYNRGLDSKESVDEFL